MCGERTAFADQLLRPLDPVDILAGLGPDQHQVSGQGVLPFAKEANSLPPDGRPLRTGQLDRIGPDIFQVIIIDVHASWIRPKGALRVPPKEVEGRKRPAQETSTTTISGFSLRFWGEPGGFPGFRGIRKRSVENVQKQGSTP